MKKYKFSKGDGYICLFMASLNLIAVIYLAFKEEHILFLILSALNLVSLGLLGGNILQQNK